MLFTFIVFIYKAPHALSISKYVMQSQIRNNCHRKGLMMISVVAEDGKVAGEKVLIR